MRIRIKRAFEDATPSDGTRVLIDRLWPRGISKERAAIDLWAKECSPSNELRKWYRHDVEKWPEFKRRYYAELEDQAEGVAAVLAAVKGSTLTLVFSSKELEWNNARAFKEYLEARSKRRKKA